MVEANYSFLTEVLEKLGFGELFNEKLRAAMKVGLDKIELKASDQRKIGEYTYNVVVEKGKGEKLSKDQEKFYFANRVEVSFTKHGMKEPLNHTFGLYKQRGFSVGQMRNLMNGAFVHNSYRNAEGETISRWQHIDFNKPKEDGAYSLKSIYDKSIQWDISRAVSNLPHINSLTQDGKEDLLRGLKNGDAVAVSLRINGNRESVYLKANPRTTNLDIFNSDGDKIQLNKSSMQLVDDNSNKKASGKGIKGERASQGKGTGSKAQKGKQAEGQDKGQSTANIEGAKVLSMVESQSPSSNGLGQTRS